VFKQGNLFHGQATVIPRCFDCTSFFHPLLPLILANLKFFVAYVMCDASSSYEPADQIKPTMHLKVSEKYECQGWISS
jgi:hypothetical protein